ncbi:MAG: hypothetical protein FWD99_05450 [Oscillospiraceae bacterium]|nr:hypothetical protein [Oscillospiraceae bacterium]
MRATLLPMYLPGRNEREQEEFINQLAILEELYGQQAEFLSPVPAGETISAQVDAVVFPQLIGSAFEAKDILSRINIPIVVLTSQFGTVEMWDWEIVSFLREETGLTVFSPYTVELAKVILRALGSKRAMGDGIRFLMFQDSPGEGMQAGIFKRFYWWEQACTARMEEAFGIKILYRSYKELNERAQALSDEQAEEVCAGWDVPLCGVSRENYLKAVKLYKAVKDTMAEVGQIHGVGANCLNESFLSETTPCLAWNMLYEKDDIIWVCEGDTVTMVSKFIVYNALKRPTMMTNIYPFLVGMAALKHEKIDTFPDVSNPDHHALGVHCGYFGLAPQSFCRRWELKPRVLEIVGEDALMVDCEIEPGPIILAKIHPNMKKMILIEAEISDYVQYPGSDCRNGALIHFKNNNGHQIMQTLCSHHALIVKGECVHELLALAQVYQFDTEVL